MYKRKQTQCEASKIMASESDKVSELYNVEHKSLSDIAKIYKTNIGVVQYFFKLYGIETRDINCRPVWKGEQSRLAWEARDEISRLYVDEMLNSDEIGQKYNLSRSTIIKILRLNGSKIRERQCRKYKRDVWEKYDEIIGLYIDEELSRVEIGKRYNCSHKTIENILKAHDIPLRRYSTNAKASFARINIDTIADLYKNQNKEIKQIAKQYNVAISTIVKLLKRAEVY